MNEETALGLVFHENLLVPEVKDSLLAAISMLSTAASNQQPINVGVLKTLCLEGPQKCNISHY